MDEPITIYCKDCGKEFVISTDEQKRFKSLGFELPKRCVECRKKKKALKKSIETERRVKQSELEAEQLQINREEREKKMQSLLDTLPYAQTDITELTSDAVTLVVIGNGFDLMHGVKSSYWDFQSTLGKRSEIRFYMETYIDIEASALWYNLEESLAHLAAGKMLDVVDMWLDVNGVYDDDDSMAAYMMSIDDAFLPIQVLCDQLPKRFRSWVETLSVSGMKPLKDMLSPDALYLNFNYTEFLETLYGVDSSHIKYIHGCRKKIKYKPKEKLILGHVPNVDYLKNYMPARGMVPRYKDKWKQAMLENAMDLGKDIWVSAYEDAFTKHTPEIIAENEDFFKKTANVEKIITIGHSLSEVDYPYFEEIVRKNNKKASWYLGYHSYEDMQRLIDFVDAIGIEDSKVTVFKT